MEAPSGCDGNGSCQQLPLGDFGTVRFIDARATTTAWHAGTIRDATWSTTKLTLSQNGSSGRGFAGASPQRGALAAALASAGGSFAVSYDASRSLGKHVVTQPSLKRAP